MDWREAEIQLGRDTLYAREQAGRIRRPSLSGTHRTEVAVVGGGLAGLSAALELADAGHQVTLLEARRLADGASGRNGGQVLPGLACDLARLEPVLGRDGTRALWRHTLGAVATVRQRCLAWKRGHWQDGQLTVAVGARKARVLREAARRFEADYAHPQPWAEGAELRRWIDSPRYAAGIHEVHAGHIDPLDYSLALADAAERAGARLHEDAAVLRLEPGPRCVLHTAEARIEAEHVVLTLGARTADLVPALAGRVLPVGTYVGATPPQESALLDRLLPTRCAVFDTDVALDYFRADHLGRIVFGGRVSYSTRTPPRLREVMQRRLAAVFPELKDARLDPVWGGFVDITMNRAPDFGRVHLDVGASMYYLQGFSGHGLALATLAGSWVAQAIGGAPQHLDGLAKLVHHRFPGGTAWRTPLLVLGMSWHRLHDLF